MNVLAWVLQGVCAAVFLYSAVLKSLMSKERMVATGQTGVAPFPTPLLRIVAFSELAGVAGLLLPQALGIAKVLTPLAACGLAVIMIGAAISHAVLREFKQVVFVNAVLCMALVAIAVIRMGEL
jgi:hypothetical protein